MQIIFKYLQLKVRFGSMMDISNKSVPKRGSDPTYDEAHGKIYCEAYHSAVIQFNDYKSLKHINFETGKKLCLILI